MSKKRTTSSPSLKKVKKLSKKAIEVGEEINDKQKLAVWLYVTDKDCFGNYGKAYKKAYDCRNEIAATAGPRLFRNVQIQAYKDELLTSFFNEKTADAELSYLMKQTKDPITKLGALKEYNKLRGRIIEKKDITSAGKPIPLLYALHNNDGDGKDVEAEEEN